MSRSPTHAITRREALSRLLGLGVLASTGCAPSTGDASAPAIALPAQVPGEEVAARSRYADDVDALCDVLLPTELDASGKVLSPGAREADVDGALRIEDFVAIASAQGILPALADADVRRLSGGADAFRAVLNAELAVLAARHRPLAAFRDLPRAVQEQIVVDAFDDDAQRPLVLVARAACFVAFLGAVTNDIGLRAVGFPAFESFEDGLAVSGYPRTKSGRLVDASTEDLARLAGKGDLDDYTYNRAPAPTPGDDLTTVLDASGDLL
ncbi:MAG: hypothetical protein JWP87_2901 [Labilithrix sp.]|nr:hypothetical protein [Labilithrix sp.]